LSSGAPSANISQTTTALRARVAIIYDLCQASFHVFAKEYLEAELFLSRTNSLKFVWNSLTDDRAFQPAVGS